MSLLAATAQASDWRLSARGLGPARIGMTLDQAARALGVRWEPMDAADSPACYYVKPSPVIPGLAVMVAFGRVVRFDIASGALRTVSGFGIGSPESAIRRQFGARVDVAPHKYLDPDGHYLTVWADDRQTAVRFETHHGVVTMLYAGGRQAIGMTEGCA